MFPSIPLSVFLLAAPSAPSTATTVVPLYVSEIAALADQIVVGTVTGSQCRLERNGQTIRTYVTLSDVTVHKGRPAGTLVLQFEGGQVGADRLWIPGMPVLTPGRRYLLYLAGNGTSLSPIVGFDQGAFEITVENRREVLKSLRGLELIGTRDDRFVFAQKAVPPEPPGAPVATPPPPVERLDAALPASRRGATPLLVPKDQDRGERISVADLVTSSLRPR